MALADRLVTRYSGVRWGLKKDYNISPVTYGLSVLVNAQLATRALMRKARSDWRATRLPSCAHGGASLVGTRGPFSLPTHVTRPWDNRGKVRPQSG